NSAAACGFPSQDWGLQTEGLDPWSELVGWGANESNSSTWEPMSGLEATHTSLPGDSSSVFVPQLTFNGIPWLGYGDISIQESAHLQTSDTGFIGVQEDDPAALSLNISELVPVLWQDAIKSEEFTPG